MSLMFSIIQKKSSIIQKKFWGKKDKSRPESEILKVR